ncbi:MAG: pyridine nucleotide-disulfide oxidoreductase [Acidobacteria bacterium]|nr:MAG: pyridine nucleotide-disulfide oxidoreductase [Acidobacteriota bacterium]
MKSIQMNNSGPAIELRLGIGGFTYPDLYRSERLKELLDVFDCEVAAANPELFAAWDSYRNEPQKPRPATEISALLVAMAGQVSQFLTRLFDIEAEAAALAAATQEENPIFRFKVDFVRRRVIPNFKRMVPPSNPELLESQIRDLREQAREKAGRGLHEIDEELATAMAAVELMQAERSPATTQEDRRRVTDALESLKLWCAVHLDDPTYRKWVSFRFPESIDHFNLVQLQRPNSAVPEEFTGPDRRLRRRDGFALTDPRMTPREILSEIHYCILCHERDKDSCSKGIKTADGKIAVNPLDIPLAGCPLDEKISEMHYMRKVGDAIGALALVMISNPLCPGTGHRICNDCMKSCIYQKQDPVNIPQIETAVVTDTLSLPWGVEIYGLLTRWNPLNIARPYALPYNGKNVLVVGMGPAGYTLAHYLVNEGFGVAGVDGLKIEPLSEELTGTPGTAPRPIQFWSEIYTPLEDRVLEGFGGVSEYGITVRWDKNFLTLLHLTLARRDLLRIYGGVRFGGTLTVDDAWEWGFHHIAMAAGAGRPTIIDMKNNLACGIRKASDFLMALQLTGAFKRTALPNLQVRLPALVIGGGLTAIDTATELFAYYPVQVEKTLERYERLVEEIGEEAVLAPFNKQELEILKEFLEHGAAARAERARAVAAGEKPNFVSLVRCWGGVSIVYRKRLVDSPAYRLNHEEVIKALEEGISFVEGLNPDGAILDEYNHVRAMRFQAKDRVVELPARAVMVAAGTSPNISYEKEHYGTFQLDSKKKFFAPHHVKRNDDGRFSLEPAPEANPGCFTSYNKEGRFITYYGDNHPLYAGNVVKAMASARDGYPHIVSLFQDEITALDPDRQDERDLAWKRLTANLDRELIARVAEVRRLTPTILEVIVDAPAAARRFHPGQFYRFQNYETEALTVNGTRLLMEGIALTGAWVDREKGLLSLIALELGVSSRLCAYLRPGEPVVVMGPTGTPTEIETEENVLLAGGGLGNAVLFSIAKEMREKGNRVIYFAGYKKGEDLFKREDIESASDQVIWSTDTGAPIQPHRPQDCHFRGNIVQAIAAYGHGELGKALVPLSQIRRIIAIGSDRMMAAVKDARHGVLQRLLQPDHIAIASINSPMQCMMKEVCAQCLQKHMDPATGKETIIFSCLNQDQPMDHVDFENLNARLKQNTVHEKLSNLWLDLLLPQLQGE